MLNEIVKNTEKYIKTHSKNIRKGKGQFFTPLSIVNYMAKKAIVKAEHLSIAEPGAGNGLLSAAVVKYGMDSGMCKSFSIRFIENDPDIMPVLKATCVLLKEYVGSRNGTIEIAISGKNYITEEKNGTYDIVICNPPYKKIRKDAKESVCMKEYIFGQPNLYALFMCKAVNHLKSGGKFVFITPRSWTSGNYYKVARKFLLESLNLEDLLLFEDRNKVFGGEDVLQETLITIGKKEKVQSSCINITTSDGNMDNVLPIKVDSKLIKGVGTEEYLLLPSSKEDIQVIRHMTSITDTFESLGYCFKTGPVVEFRNKKALSLKKREGYIPMYRTANIIDGKCIFPADTNKAQYVSAVEKKLLLTDMNTVFLRRMSAKEERRRLQSCVYYKTDVNQYFSVENHVNYLVHIDGSPISADEAEWINELLMSEEYDIYYRIINGSTQVNASEINKLPLQRRAE